MACFQRVNSFLITCKINGYRIGNCSFFGFLWSRQQCRGARIASKARIGADHGQAWSDPAEAGEAERGASIVCREPGKIDASTSYY